MRSRRDPVNVSLVIRSRLEEFGLEQQDLAQAAHVTESYISQLLTGKRVPPAPNRTDIYDKMDKFLKLPTGELARLADHERKEQLKRELGDEPAPLFREVRALILRKCQPDAERHVRAVFEKEPFSFWVTRRSSSPKGSFSNTARTCRSASGWHLRRINARTSRNNGAGSSPSSRFNCSLRSWSANRASSPVGSFKNLSILS